MLIWKRKQHVFAHIDPDQLMLWKVEGLSEGNRKWEILETKSYSEIDIKQEFGGEKLFSTIKFRKVFPGILPDNAVHIIVQLPRITGESLFVPMKRPGEYQIYNRDPIAPLERKFWNELSEAQIVFKLPDNIYTTTFMSGPLSEYMSVKGKEIILSNHVMLNAQDELILNNGELVIVESKKITMNFAKFLRFRKSPDGIVFGISTQDILIKRSYLQIDRNEKDAKGYIIYEQPFQENSLVIHIKSNVSVFKISSFKVEYPPVKELIVRWGCIPRRVFNEYNYEPNVDDVVSQCDAYAYLKNDGGDLIDNYSGKAIHIIPNSDFTNKKYVPASTEISGKFFEMMVHDILRKGDDFAVRRLIKDGVKQPEELHLKNVAHKQFRNIDEIAPDTNFESVGAIAPQRNGIHHLYQMTTAETQKYVTSGNTKYLGWHLTHTEWIRDNVIQYVLLINLSDF
ncbi:766_t:CDS:2 [Diversispora eburnea]|uniref:766_t:CDS:1 n=1 Tax=Diversispora eburnea TaxID=1213867 RepID=A0A9N8YIV0_9GLOM|nr:766_t:CDS:2 [Diversispora eburnea]